MTRRDFVALLGLAPAFRRLRKEPRWDVRYYGPYVYTSRPTQPRIQLPGEEAEEPRVGLGCMKCPHCGKCHDDEAVCLTTPALEAE